MRGDVVGVATKGLSSGGVTVPLCGGSSSTTSLSSFDGAPTADSSLECSPLALLPCCSSFSSSWQVPVEADLRCRAATAAVRLARDLSDSGAGRRTLLRIAAMLEVASLRALCCAHEQAGRVWRSISAVGDRCLTGDERSSSASRRSDADCSSFSPAGDPSSVAIMPFKSLRLLCPELLGRRFACEILICELSLGGLATLLEGRSFDTFARPHTAHPPGHNLRHASFSVP